MWMTQREIICFSNQDAIERTQYSEIYQEIQAATEKSLGKDLCSGTSLLV
jgi:hypothetical protein